MRSICFILSLSSILNVLSTNSAVATGQLFEPDFLNTETLRTTSVNGVLDEAVVNLDKTALTPFTEQLRLTLLDGQTYLASELTYQAYRTDWEVWSGHLSKDGSGPGITTGYILLNLFESRLSGVMHTTNDLDQTVHYELVTEQHAHQADENQTHFLLKVSNHTDCPLNVYLANDTEQAVASTRRILPLGDSKPAGTNGTSSLTIDVMSLYAREFLASQAEEDMARSFITTAIALANDTFRNSASIGQPQIVYRLVHMGPIPDTTLALPDQPDSTGLPENKAVTIANEWHNDGPPLTTAMRTAYGADMVALWIPLVEDPVRDVCGVANLPYNGATQEVIDRLIGGGVEAFSQRAFTALEIGCGQTDFTFAHEHGHNFGMKHDGEGGIHPTPILPYALGHVLTVSNKATAKTTTIEKASVMACSRDDGATATNGVCNRIAHFSNPDIDYMGVPTGDSLANNALVVAERAALYAAFKTPVSQTTPSVQIVQPSDGTVVTAGTTFRLQGSATDVEDGILDSQIQWISDRDGTLGSGALLDLQLSSVGHHIISAIVTDSGGKRVEEQVRIRVASNAEIRVTLAATGQIIENGGSFIYPATSVDDLPIGRLFDICNDGQDNLLLNNPASLVSGQGFSQIGDIPASSVPPNACTSVRVRFDAVNPDAYQGILSISNSDANENPYVISLTGTAAASRVQLVARYTPGLGQQTDTFAVSSDNPVQQTIYFDPNQGRFEQRPGGACDNQQTPNPTYLTLTLGGEILNQGGVDSCSYEASWDNGQMFDCDQAVVDQVNLGQEIIINTDDHLTNLQNCEYQYPLQPHVGYAEAHWLRVNFVVNGAVYQRRFRFRQSADIRRYPAVADTYISQSEPDRSFGSEARLLVQNSAAGDGKFLFARFNINPGFSNIQVGSAALHLHLLNNPVSHMILHDVCGNQWQENTLSWNNWVTETGGDCGEIETHLSLEANRAAVFDVTAGVAAASNAFSDFKKSFGANSADPQSNRAFASQENNSPAKQPTLIVTYAR